MRRPHRLASIALVATATLWARAASATYSILAYDRQSGALGGAVASCVPLDTVARVYAATPLGSASRGAVVTQSYLYDPAQPAALDALAAGDGAEATIAALTDPAFDSSFSLRQYAAVDADGGAAVFSGDDALAWAGHRSFDDGRFVGSAQGNILTGAPVVERARAALLDAEACGLGERLMRALEAGAAGGAEGDSRCIAGGKAALAATLEIDPKDGAPVRLAIETFEGDGRDPIAELRAAFDAVAADACELPPPSNGGGPPRKVEPEPTGGCAVAAGHPRGMAVGALLVVALAAALRGRSRPSRRCRARSRRADPRPRTSARRRRR